MKKIKKFLLSTLSLALVAVLSVAGTLAYLTSEDSDVNVMTMGNVKIAQHEYERAENEDGSYKTDTIDNQTSYVLKEFTQAKPLLPIVGDPSTGAAGWDNTIVRMTQVDSYGSMQVFAGKVAQDKFVTVENTGKNDAYIRTLVAIEVGNTNADLIGISYHQTWTKNGIGTFSANDTTYYLYEFVYNGGQLSDGSWRHENGVLPAGETSYPNLSQVYLKSEATNEDCEALDGNKNGLLDILVLSQAVQTSGFENAKTALDTSFGETNATNAALWFAGMKLDVLTELPKEKDEQGEQVKIDKDTIINLTKDDEAPYVEITEGKTVINGNMNTAKVSTATDYAFIVHSELEINDLEVNAHNGGGIASVNGGKVTFNGTGLQLNATTTNPRYNFYAEGAGSEIIINGGEFDIAVKTLKRAYIYAGAGTTVYVNGGIFGKASTRSGYTAGILGSGKVIITGGTFGFNPSNWVAAGYKAVQNGSTWTVVAE